MYIKSTKYVRELMVPSRQLAESLRTTRSVSVPVDVGRETPDEEIETATINIARQGKVERLSFSFKFDSGDPQDIQGAADYVESLAGALNKRAAALAPDTPKPSIDFVRTGSGATIGAIGGYSTALLLQELGKAGSTTGNPFLSTLAIACSIGGAAIGAGVGSGMLQGEVSAFGATLKTPGESEEES